MGNVLAAEINVTASWDMKTRDHVQGCRFAASRWAKQANKLSIRNDKRHIIYGGHLRAFLAREDFL